jgi:hypothetical protein
MPAKARQHLLELAEGGSGAARVLDVLEKERLVGLPVEPLPACVGARLAEKPVEPPREQVPDPAAAPDPFHDALIQQRFEAGLQEIRRRLLSVYEVQDEELLGGEVESTPGRLEVDAASLRTAQKRAESLGRRHVGPLLCLELPVSVIARACP